MLLWRLGSSWRGVGTSWCDLGELLGRLESQFSVSLEPSWRQDGPKLVPRCSKLAPEWSSGCDLGSHSPDFKGLGTNLQKNHGSQKSNDSTTVFAIFSSLGGSGWTLSGTILGDLGHKFGYLGRSWPQVGNFWASCWHKDGDIELRWAS